jgi:hypothetical protein
MRLIALVCVLSLPSLALAQRGAATGRPGTVEIESVTQGAEVDIDGEKAGTIPLSGPLTLPPGEHTIKVIKPGFTPYIDVFKIDRKKPTKLSIELIPVAGVLRLSSSVENSRVYVDGKFVGEAPLTTEVAVGAREIKVQKGGYKDFTQNISAVAGQDVNLDVMMEELPAGLNPYKPPPPPPKLYEKWWVWTVAAVGVGAVVTAVVVPVYYATRDPLADFCKANACQGGVISISLMPIPK